MVSKLIAEFNGNQKRIVAASAFQAFGWVNVSLVSQKDLVWRLAKYIIHFKESRAFGYRIQEYGMFRNRYKK
jgi:hypothetical protein